MGSSLIVLITLSSFFAAADPAEILIKQGVELRRAGNDAKAFQKFERAYQMSHSPRAAAQLGLCEQALEEWEAAEGHLSEALTSSADLWVGQNRKTIQSALEKVRKQLVLVTVAGEPPNAMASVNNRVLGTLAESPEVRVTPGPVTIDVTAPGYHPFHESRSASAGESLKIATTLTLLTPDVAAPVAAVSESATQASQVHEKRSAEPVSHSAFRSIAKWSAGGASVVGLGLGVFGVLQNRSGVNEFNASCGFRDGQATPLPNRDLSPAACDGLARDYEQAATLATIGFVSAAAFGSVALWLHLTEPKSTDSRALSCLPNFGSAMGAACQGSF